MIHPKDRYNQRDAANLSPDIVKAAARLLIPNASSVAIAKLSGGFSNGNFLATAGERRYVLRFYWAGRELAEREMAVLKIAKKNGVAVPEIFEFREFSGQAVALMEYIDGTLLEDELLAGKIDCSAVFFECGRQLATIHAVKFPTAGLFGANGKISQKFDFNDECLNFILPPLDGLAGQRLGDAMVQDIRKLISDKWRLASDFAYDPCLVHCDFNPKNILVSQNAAAPQTVVIDWEFGMAGHPLADIGNFLRFENWDYRPSLTEEFLKGYRSIGSQQLSEDWLPAAKLIDLAALVNFMNNPLNYAKTFNTAKILIEQTLAWFKER